MSSNPPDSDRSLIADVMRQVNDADRTNRTGPGQIGDFEIRDVLGRGGMGIVYRARQQHPQRDVALKILRATMVNSAMLRRFDREAQVLGRLHHIGIAQIYEAGMDDLGFGPQPFFAMELVDGAPITDYCDRHQLDIPARLMLLAKVCDAVDHAHQKKIIHRDLKPSNILVTDEGQPKILDFGVARVTESNIGPGTMVTEARKMVGTLPFMSPEQVTDDTGLVDARSDVYSLGVLAYRMLTGRHPFSVNRRSIPQAIVAIQEEEPMRLSLIDRQLGGDIETIVLKALEKEPNRRYQSAADLGADIRRFLNHEPVLARPASAGYRLKKFVRRNRSLAYSIVAIFSIMLIALVLTTRSSQLAQQRLEDFRRLADVRELQRIKSEAERLYPAIPANILPMERWVERADKFRVKLQLYRDQLTEAHERASETYLYKQNDPENIHLIEEQFEIKTRLRAIESDIRLLDRKARLSADDQSLLDALRIERTRLKDHLGVIFYQIPREHVCRFEDPADLVEHDVLVELVNGLKEFFDPILGPMAGVRRRLRFAKQVYQNSIVNFEDEWNTAIAAIGDETRYPAYRGLRIKPQIGLVPLGPDPTSNLWEFSDLQTGDIPLRDERGRLLLTPTTGLVFVLMPGRPAFMTCVESSTNTFPIASVPDTHLSPEEAGFFDSLGLAPFFLAKYEMTQGQWEEFKLNNPSRYYPEYSLETDITPLHPVENISWSDANLVLWQLGWQIPSEAQWQFACGPMEYSSDQKDSFKSDIENAVHAPVDQTMSNALGIHGMAGNVAEWCKDAFAGFDHPVAPDTGRRLTGRGERGYRVIRGSDFRLPRDRGPYLLRRSADLNFRHPTVGVRPVREID